MRNTLFDEKIKPRVYLGGTCNGSTWRDEMIAYFSLKDIDYFNPVVDEWNKEEKENELNERERCDYCLYVITPRMLGVYSVAEVTDDSNKRPDKTILVILKNDKELSFDTARWNSLLSLENLVKKNGAHTFTDLRSVAVWINKNN